jgi:hypothetical protein
VIGDIEKRAGIQLAQRCQRELVDRTALLGGAIYGLVMDDDDMSIGAELGVNSMPSHHAESQSKAARVFSGHGRWRRDEQRWPGRVSSNR